MAKTKPEQKPDPALDHILRDLRGLAQPLAELTLDPGNERKHPRANIDSIKGSLREFGIREPVGVRSGTSVVTRGNGTVIALRELHEEKATGLWPGAGTEPVRWDLVPVVRYDDDDRRAATWRMTHNRTGELSTWNWEVLSENLRDIAGAEGGPDLLTLGWERAELDLLLQADWAPPKLADASDPAAADGAAGTDIQAIPADAPGALILKLEGGTAELMRELAAAAKIKPIELLAQWIAKNG
jgi:hypothetical protein